MSLYKYISETRTYTDPFTNNFVELTQNQEYDINIRYDGPQMIVNGQPIILADSTVWITLQGNDGPIQLPYAPSCLPRQWEGLNL